MIHVGDCVEVMAGMEPASVDAVVTDPPYGLEFMGVAWDRLDWRDGGGFSKPGIGARDTAWVSHGGETANPTCSTCGGRLRGIRKCQCDVPMWRVKGEPMTDRTAARSRTAQEFHSRWATEAFRVAKPGAYLLAFGGTRTYHRMTCAIEDAGWIIRDCLVWAYASGFPKSRALLKPAWEPIVMARKPGPLRELRIDACRIGTEAVTSLKGLGENVLLNDDGWKGIGHRPEPTTSVGRWPANVILTDPIFDGDMPGVVGGGETSSGFMAAGTKRGPHRSVDYGVMPGTANLTDTYADSGTYSRFFVIPKADRAEREPVLASSCSSDALVPWWCVTHQCPWPPLTICPGRERRANVHPTVKPLDLMRHLVRLVTPTGGTVLDPFAGSGTTLLAAEIEGFPWIGIEREPEYVAIAEARLNGTQRGLGLPA